MSNRYKGGVISATPPTTSTTAASGAWTLEQQMQAQAAGTWPAPPNYIEEVFSTYLYTGNGATQTITNGIDLSGKGGMVWGKSRSNAYDNFLADSVRGSSKLLYSNNTYAQQTDANVFSSFNSNGFSLGIGGAVSSNTNGATYVSWTFRKQPKFFDVVTYTGNGTAGRTIAHNLGSVPGCMIVKSTSDVVAWQVYHRSTGATDFLVLNTTAATQPSISPWNNTAPTSSVFTVGDGFGVNNNGSTYVAYLFAHDAGGFGLTGSDNVISCGAVTYDSTNGNTINLGYEAQFVILKSATAVTQWYMQDIMRGMASGPDSGARLFPNLSNAEDSGFIVGPTATGFNIKPSFFSNGNNVIYIAIRRGPMKTPTIGTSVFKPTAYAGSEPTPQYFATGFTGDMNWYKYRDLDIGTSVWGRLTGGAYGLVTSSNGGQVDISGDSGSQILAAQFQRNNGFSVGTGAANAGGTQSINYAFQRAPGFFDMVAYTGTGTPTNFTHNLGVVPELMIVKRRDSTSIWAVYAGALANAATSYFDLSASDARVTGNGILWNSTAPTSTVFTIGASSNINTIGSFNVAYLFATLAGISKVGSYTGTGALQTINCGFTSGARFVLIKNASDVGNWYVYDSARGITSGNDPYLFINSTSVEVSNTNFVDTDTTGFKVTAAAPAGLNFAGNTYIFLAIA
jgi:hypothetical protein